MAEPSGAPLDADLAAVAGIVERASAPDLAGAIAFIRTRHRLDRRCRLPDHLAALRREAARLSESQADVMVGVINTLLDGLELTDEAKDRGRALASATFRRLAALEAR